MYHEFEVGKTKDGICRTEFRENCDGLYEIGVDLPLVAEDVRDQVMEKLERTMLWGAMEGDPLSWGQAPFDPITSSTPACWVFLAAPYSPYYSVPSCV